MEFPEHVKSTPCEFRSQTVIIGGPHGVTNHTVKVSNKDLPMVFEKKMSAGWKRGRKVQ